MQPLFWISILVLTLIVVGALLVFVVATRKSSADSGFTAQEKHPQGYWIGVGISIGAGFGVALGTTMGNIGIGIPIGVGTGIAIGSALEQRNKDKIRPLTEDEKKLQRWGTGLGLVILAVRGTFA